jgi:hypothetical protein
MYNALIVTAHVIRHHHTCNTYAASCNDNRRYVYWKRLQRAYKIRHMCIFYLYDFFLFFLNRFFARLSRFHFWWHLCSYQELLVNVSTSTFFTTQHFFNISKNNRLPRFTMNLITTIPISHKISTATLRYCTVLIYQGVGSMDTNQTLCLIMTKSFNT